MLLTCDELAAFIGAFDRYHQGGKVSAGRAHALELYDGGPTGVDRVKGQRSSRTGRPSIVGSIQLEKLRPIVGDLATDGLLQRFVTVYPGAVLAPTRKTTTGPGTTPRTTLTTGWCRRLRTLRPPKRAGGGFLHVRAGEDAKEPRRRVFRLVERIMADPTLPAPLRETASKWRGLVARLALLFHCIGLAEKTSQTSAGVVTFGTKIARRDKVTLAASTVDMAANFVLRVVARSAFALYRELGLTGDPHARWIAGHILANRAEHISARDIGRAYRELARRPVGHRAGDGAARARRLGDGRRTPEAAELDGRPARARAVRGPGRGRAGAPPPHPRS